MYDKYNNANPITIGSKIPKHKGILFSGGTGGTPAITLHAYNTSGVTVAISATVTQSPYIFPMDIYTIPSALPAGVTAYYIN